MPVTGLAKQREELFLPGRSDPILLPPASQGLFLIQRIRDEAHRFAITAHREKRSQGFGDVRVGCDPGHRPGAGGHCYEHFGSLEAIREASEEQLAHAPGMTLAARASIRENL